VWPVATYGCESWTPRKRHGSLLTFWRFTNRIIIIIIIKNEETRLDVFEMKGLRKILQVSWTAKKTNNWVLNKAGVKRELSDTVKSRKLTYYGHTIRKQGSCLEKEITQGTMPGARRRRRPRTAWMDNINTWTGLPVELKSQSD